MTLSSKAIGQSISWTVVLLIIAVRASAAYGEQPAATTPAVQQASFDRASSRGERQAVQFGRRATRVGDKIEQRLTLEVRLNTSLRQGNELIEKSRTAVHTTQRRVVTTTDVEGDRTTAVEVHYLEATKQLTAGDSVDTPGPAAQPVQGKTYRCRRAAGKLIITGATGQVPPPEEYRIVAQHMEMVGRANPLAQFLAGRTVAVGETLELPKELAAQIFNLGDRYGETTRFDLALEKVEPHDGAACAVFLARVEAASNDSSQMRMQVEGPLVMQIDTCRAVRFALSGPIGMSETRGSYSTVCQLLGTGQLKMSIDSAYHDAKR